ncbi:hypothetical protein HL658_24305 [Azospirillum sp. RWY-5-1]|uniref:Uncharacterized protein n=1 Tax=Azospirillum oleiclasticum TaxID=2735135 RepID=A0ABX2TCN2_9PROT|nr:hypothetical protein [Azospirillum oleiclasticum]NYZ15676.1 hypothetical protein [Azospirillum oleiclasticum]NYZ21946.1 hypothetical protein [Azospirillum oleiclasticum]
MISAFAWKRRIHRSAARSIIIHGTAKKPGRCEKWLKKLDPRPRRDDGSWVARGDHAIVKQALDNRSTVNPT